MEPRVDVTRDDWRRVKAIAAAALDVAPDSRLEYIASARGGDERIDREVTSRRDGVACDRSILRAGLPLDDMNSAIR